MKNHEIFMKRAIELSRYGALVKKSGGVFGAVVVKDGLIIGEGYNQVILHNDPTWHAEMHAIREACKNISSPHLDNCILYTSAQCCPMCLAASYWAHIEHIYYASSIEDSLLYGNFQDEHILEEIRKNSENQKIKSTELLRSEAVLVWQEFGAMSDRAYY